MFKKQFGHYLKRKIRKSLRIATKCITFAPHLSPDGGIGRRAGLKHQWGNPCRFDPGSGYEFNSNAIAKPLKIRGLAIFLFSIFPTFSPHLQFFVQSKPRLPHKKKHELGMNCDPYQNEESFAGTQSKTLIANQYN